MEKQSQEIRKGNIRMDINRVMSRSDFDQNNYQTIWQTIHQILTEKGDMNPTLDKPADFDALTKKIEDERFTEHDLQRVWGTVFNIGTEKDNEYRRKGQLT